MIYGEMNRNVSLAHAPAPESDSWVLGGILRRWQVRVLAFVSLIMQLILVRYGSRKNCKATSVVPLVVWMAYMLADWVAILGLSSLLHRIDEFRAPKTEPDLKFVMREFWCPFLLLHLGGPDTITSYSLEDNEIWLRHVLSVAIQLGFASYLYIMFFSNPCVTFEKDPLPYLAIIVFAAGIMKCADRNWCLRTASEQQRRSSLFSVPVPKSSTLSSQTPTTSSTSAGGGHVQLQMDHQNDHDVDLPGSNLIFPQASHLHHAYFLFNVSRYLISGVNLKIRSKFGPQFTKIGSVSDISFQKAFRLIEIEIGLLYDVLYTKVPLIHTHWGRIHRLLNFLCSVFVIVAFNWVVNDKPYNNIKHSLDVTLTWSMVFAWFCLEIYWFFYHIFSNWTLLCLSRNTNNTFFVSLYNFVSRCIPDTCSGKRESFYMAQHNLIRLCFHTSNAKRFRYLRLFNMFHDQASKYMFTALKPVNDDLKEAIFTYLQHQYRHYASANFSYEFLTEVLGRRGDYSLQKHIERDLSRLSWSTSEVDFDHSILLWHIATDLCYYKDLAKVEDQNKNNLGANCRRSKFVSDYMFYLLVTHPTMLPQGISDLRVKDTVTEIVKIFERRKVVHQSSKVENRLLKACEELWEHSESEQPKQLRNKSTLSSAIELGKRLMETRNKWEVISEVWIEMLCYAASHCEWKEHAKQLGRGVELLTHVSLIMAHLGFTPNIHFAQSAQSATSEDILQNDMKLPDIQKNVQHFILSCLT